MPTRLNRCTYCQHTQATHSQTLGFCEVKDCTCHRFVEPGALGRGKIARDEGYGWVPDSHDRSKDRERQGQ